MNAAKFFVKRLWQYCKNLEKKIYFLVIYNSCVS